MRSGGGHELPQKSLQIKQDDKFFSRLVSRESSIVNSSCRVYYGGSPAAIPFLWESQPGTPKHTFSDTSLPPLTPPPSYQCNSKRSSMQKHSKPKLLYTIFPRLARRKTHMSASSSSSISSSSTCSSSYSSSSSSMIRNSRGRCYSVHSGSPLHMVDDDNFASGSPTSTLCFGVKCRNTISGFRSCYSMVNVKNAISSVVGHK